MQGANVSNHTEAECGADFRAPVRIVSSELIMQIMPSGQHVYSVFSMKTCKAVILQLIGNYFQHGEGSLRVSLFLG